MIRALVVLVGLLVLTPWFSGLILGAALFRVPLRDGSVYWWSPQRWAKLICRIAGVRVKVIGLERLTDPTPRVLVANHVSWFDVFSLCSVLPRFAFVAKAELRRIPIFGRAAAATGQVFIERANRKAAFAEYEKAASRIREGITVVIFPEGTRGSAYPLRPFKKGPFVLAISAGAPIIPILIHGTLEVHSRGSVRVRPNEVTIHVLDPIPSTGFTYDQRDVLAARAYDAMARAQFEHYGISSPPSTTPTLTPCP